MLAFLKIDMLSVVQKIANAWEQVSPKTLKKSWRKLISFDESSVEKNATCLESVLNNEFVEQFAALNIELTTSDIDGWFQADGPVYEHMDKQGIVDLVSAAEDEECDEEEDTDENTGHLTQKEKCPVRTQRQCECLTVAQRGSVFSQKHQFQTLPHWYDFVS